MLQVKNITKTYRPKKGVPVTALDDVSLAFGDKGLVFILGKSGSGKSTLLNLVGGLDRADSGEFVIEGKSSKEFKGSDFDSYRNTFIGFIFQEYNILNEFNVKSNIALAMELQGKKATDAAIEAILQEVDLGGFGGRKPNELSGGQIQRVAIARALVKEPKIIMADEPTGALDSNTGRQVFDTLKKLSKEKLVLVVSHDREFAEYYGDRVIELEDGKVVSDILKYHAVAERASEGVSIVDGDILRIEQDYLLTESDLALINDYLKSHSAETIISSDKRANDGLKRAAMIDKNGAKESFRETSEASLSDLGIAPTAGDPTKFVKSRMPYGKAFKMGVSGLKNKPVRLFFTILLSFVALAMFGIADTLAAYNKVDNTVRSLTDNKIETATFVKNDFSYNNRLFTERDLVALSGEAGLQFKGVLKADQQGSYSDTISLPNLNASSNGYDPSYSYYQNTATGFFEIKNQEELSSHDAALLAGRLPASGNEIAISKYLFLCYQKAGLRDAVQNVVVAKDKLTLDDSETGILLKTLTFDRQNCSLNDVLLGKYTIVGVVDTRVPSKYDSLIADSGDNFGFGVQDYMKMNEFKETINSGLHKLFMVCPGFVAEKIAAIKLAEEGYAGSMLNDRLYFRQKNNSTGFSTSTRHIMKLDEADRSAIVWLGAESQTLGSEQLVFSLKMVNEILNNEFGNAPINETLTYYNYDTGVEVSDNFEQYRDFYHLLLSSAARDEILKNGVPRAFATDFQTEINQILDYYYWSDQAKLYLAERAVYTKFLMYRDAYSQSGIYSNPYGVSGNVLLTNALVDFMRKKDVLDEILPEFEFDRNQNSVDGNSDYASRKAKVVGIYAGDPEFMGEFSRENSVILSDEVYSAFATEPGYFAKAIAPMPKTAAEIKTLVQLHYRGLERNNGYKMQNGVVSSFSGVNGMIESLVKIFLYIGIGLAVFSAFLLANFIAISVSNKKREIGILRAVGAKSSDVYSIFFSESLVIAALNYVLALVGTITASVVLNRVFAEQIGISISLLNFGLRQIALMFGISLAVAAAATFLPVYFIAKKRPIEAIRGK